jgi:predicted MFS family arabinose efflux permease
MFTTSLFGMLADRFGKLPVFRVLALTMLAPILLLTNLPPVPLALALTVTTLLWVVSSGRMVPAMAMITSSAAPAYRGSFMSVNASVQQLAAGLAALAGGALVSQPAKDAPLEGFPLLGVLCCAVTALSVWLAGYVRPAAEAALPPAEPADALSAEAGLPTPDVAEAIRAPSTALEVGRDAVC